MVSFIDGFCILKIGHVYLSLRARTRGFPLVDAKL